MLYAVVVIGSVKKGHIELLLNVNGYVKDRYLSNTMSKHNVGVCKFKPI